MVAKRDYERGQLPHRKKQNLKLQKAWNKKQRAEETDYAKRQKEAKRLANQTEHGKQLAKESSKRNIKTKMECNRRRYLKKKSVKGSHTKKQWIELKLSYGNCCAACGISELEIAIKWANTNFKELTRDHKIPISKGGADYIQNIQPLCISCNARKRDKINAL